MVNSYRQARVLVTGATSGIGSAFVTGLLEQQAQVVATGRDGNKLEMLQKQSSGQIIPVRADLTTGEGVKRVIKACDEYPVDVVINNAGAGFVGEFTEGEAKDYEYLIQLNIASVTELSHHFAKQFQRRGSGGILNVASMAGITPVPYFAVYSATKAYVIHLTRALHEEMKGTGVHATVVNPGPTATPFYANAAGRSRLAEVTYKNTPKHVVRYGLKGLLKNKPEVFPDWRERWLATFSAMLPQKWSISAAGKAMRKRQVRDDD